MQWSLPWEGDSLAKSSLLIASQSQSAQDVPSSKMEKINYMNFPAAVVITADSQAFAASRVLLAALGFQATQGAHVHPQQHIIECERRGVMAPVTNLGGLGAFLAHRAVWSHIANLRRRMLILEHDWSIGNRSISTVRAELHEAWQRAERQDIDISFVGHCAGWPFMRWFALCSHAYIISPRAAKCLSRTRDCGEPMFSVSPDFVMDAACLFKDLRCDKPRHPLPTMARHHALGTVQQLLQPTAAHFLDVDSLSPENYNKTRADIGQFYRHLVASQNTSAYRPCKSISRTL